jgi:phosphoglycerate-specific signal transduction histidine kinase
MRLGEGGGRDEGGRGDKVMDRFSRESTSGRGSPKNRIMEGGRNNFQNFSDSRRLKKKKKKNKIKEKKNKSMEFQEEVEGRRRSEIANG